MLSKRITLSPIHLLNLKEFKFHCGFKEFKVDLPREMFQGLSN